MRSADECLVKAAEMERLALRPATPTAVLEWLLMARQWRDMAHHAAWQDAFGPAA